MEADAVVVGRDHVRRGDDAAVAVAAEHAALAPDELAGGEVAVARRDVVEQDVRGVALRAQQDHADRLVPAGDEEGVLVAGGRVVDELGVEPQDVRAVHAQHVPQVLVVATDLQHLEGRLVVAIAHQRDDEPEVDRRQHDVHADHRPHLEGPVEDREDQAGREVEDAQAQHPRLEQGVHEECTSAPAEDVEPVVIEPVHERRLLPGCHLPTKSLVTLDFDPTTDGVPR